MNDLLGLKELFDGSFAAVHLEKKSEKLEANLTDIPKVHGNELQIRYVVNKSTRFI